MNYESNKTPACMYNFIQKKNPYVFPLLLQLHIAKKIIVNSFFLFIVFRGRESQKKKKVEGKGEEKN